MRVVRRIDTNRPSAVAGLLLAAVLALPAAAHAQANGADGDDVVTHLIQRLSSRSAGERAGAASQLGKLGARAEPAVPFLIDLLDDDEEAFGGWDPNGHEMTMTPAGCASSALVAMGPVGVSALIAALQSRKAEVRERAAQSLWLIDDPRTPEALFSVADDRNVDVRYAALVALPRDDPRTLEHSLAAVADRDYSIRKLGADRLAMFRDPRAVDALIELVRRDDDVDIVCEATGSLADIGDPRAVPALLDALADTRLDPTARSCAASARDRIVAPGVPTR